MKDYVQLVQTIDPEFTCSKEIIDPVAKPKIENTAPDQTDAANRADKDITTKVGHS